MLDFPHIRTLGPTEKIREAGFYRMPIEQHHGQPCDGFSVTSGILRKMETHTPADVWAFHQLNQNRWTRKETDALLLGRAMASYIEGGLEELQASFVVLPDDKPSKPTAAQLAAIAEGKGTEAGKRSSMFWAAQARDKRGILTQIQWDLIVTMGSVVRDDPAALAALGGEPEITMAWYDEINDLWCLSRPDQLDLSGMLSDYKKVSTQGRAFNGRLVDRRIEEHAYHQQMAFAAEGFEFLTGRWPQSVGLVFQSDEPPHHVILRDIADEWLHVGMFQNRRARRRIRECLNSGYWPGPGEDVGTWQPSQSFRERMQEQMAQEELPRE